jgi:endonuclease-3
MNSIDTSSHVTQNKQRSRIVLTELKRLFPESKTILEFSNHFELLVAIMLSAQTTDIQVNVVTRKLFTKYPKLTDYVDANDEKFAQDVSSVNYYKTKAKHILATARRLHTEFGGKLPETVEEMISFPGVGRKTALVVLGNAYNIVEGIAVDTHVQRLSRVFKLTKHTAPEKIETDLKKLFPKSEWFQLTNRMIEYGRKYCPARCKHESCPIISVLKKQKLY